MFRKSCDTKHVKGILAVKAALRFLSGASDAVSPVPPPRRIRAIVMAELAQKSAGEVCAPSKGAATIGLHGAVSGYSSVNANSVGSPEEAGRIRAIWTRRISAISAPRGRQRIVDLIGRHRYFSLRQHFASATGINYGKSTRREAGQPARPL